MFRAGIAAAGLGLALLATPGLAQEERENVLAFTNGTVLLDYSSQYGDDRASSQWISLALIDEDPALGWASSRSAPMPQVFTFELAQDYALDGFAFDNTQSEDAGYSARMVRIDVSTESAEGPYETAFSGEIELEAESTVALDTPRDARWVRLIIEANGGREDFTELMEVKAYGTPLGARIVPDNIAGTFDTVWGAFFITLDDGAVRGCYNHDNGRFSGAFDGGFLNIEWREDNDQVGQAVMALTEDGQIMNGFWYEKGSRQGTWYGTLMSDVEPPSCAEDLMAPTQSVVGQALDEAGVAVLRGIYFDLDSDVLRPESTETLNQVLAWLEENPDRAVTFAGHTDAQGADDYNMDLSDRRAAAVVTWLVNAGISGDRMQAEGFGETQPVADNASPAGRALNRRVEVSLN